MKNNINANFGESPRRESAERPQGHYQRTAACPPLARLVDGRLTQSDEEHASHCAYCRKVLRLAQRTDAFDHHAPIWNRLAVSPLRWRMMRPVLQVALAFAALAALFASSAHDRRVEGQISSIQAQLTRTAGVDAEVDATVRSAVAAWDDRDRQIQASLGSLQNVTRLAAFRVGREERETSDLESQLRIIAAAARQNATSQAGIETQLTRFATEYNRKDIYQAIQQADAQIADIRASLKRLEEDHKTAERLRTYEAAYYDTHAELEQARDRTAQCELVPTNGRTAQAARTAVRNGTAKEWTGTLAFDLNHADGLPLRFMTMQGQWLKLDLATRQGQPTAMAKIVGKLEGNSILPERITILGPH